MCWKQKLRKIKQKAINKDKYYNCQKYRQFKQNCRFSNQKSPKQQFLNHSKKPRQEKSKKQQFI